MILYGQTSSGKTFTLFGDRPAAAKKLTNCLSQSEEVYKNFEKSKTTKFKEQSLKSFKKSATIRGSKSKKSVKFLKNGGKGDARRADQGKQGIIPRYLQSLFRKIQKLQREDNAKFTFEYSFFEIYREKIYDLLNQTYDFVRDEQGEIKKVLKPLSLREKLNNQVEIGRPLRLTPEHLFAKKSEELAQVLDDLEWANSRKHINETFMNQRSSRSHTIMTFNVKVVTPLVVERQPDALDGEDETRV